MLDWIQINVSDKCNLCCNQCHWFSQPVKQMETVTPKDVISFVDTWHPRIVQFSGGEPTLWDGLVETINALNLRVKVILSTNGTRPEILENIKRPIKLNLSYHKGIDPSLFGQSVSVAKRKEFVFDVASFDRVGGPIELIQENQLDVSKNDPRIGKKVNCRPTKIYFGSDGRAYWCEKGLRSKADEFYAGFTLTIGIPRREFKQCKIDWFCCTAKDEQEFCIDI